LSKLSFFLKLAYYIVKIDSSTVVDSTVPSETTVAKNITDNVIMQPSEIFDSFAVEDVTLPSETVVAKSLTENVNQNSFNLLINISTDPAEWPLIINNNFKTLLVERSPPNPLNANFIFPIEFIYSIDDQGRKFMCNNVKCNIAQFIIYFVHFV